MKIGVFIRMQYAEPISELRLRLFDQACKRSLLRQWYKDFDAWAVTSGMKWDGKPRVSAPNRANDAAIIAASGGLRLRCGDIEEVPWGEYNVQARIDCDDYASDGWLLKCAMEYQAMTADEMLLSFAPYRVDNGMIYGGTSEWHDKHPSMFPVLLQRNPRKSILKIGGHGRMHTFVPNVKHIPEGYCAWKTDCGDNFSAGSRMPDFAYSVKGTL